MQVKDRCTLRTLSVHSLGLAWCAFGVYHDQLHYHMPAFDNYGGRAQFLTMWCSYSMLVGVALGTLCDLVQMLTERMSFLLTLRDHFMVIWSSLTVIVPLLYWVVVVVDKEGMHPDSMEKLLPIKGWFNQYLHTLPPLHTLVSHTLVRYKHPSVGITLVYGTLLNAAYTGLLLYLGSVTGVYVYPFLNTLPTAGFVAFLAVSNVLSILCYLLVKKFSEQVWGKVQRVKFE